MTTTPTIDSIAETILARCESPNTIETGLTSTPIFDGDEIWELDSVEEHHQILTRIAQRFPVNCSRITRITERHHAYTFIIAEMPKYVGYETIRLEIKHGTTSGGEYEISGASMKINSIAEATAYAKAINAIAEFAETQVAS